MSRRDPLPWALTLAALAIFGALALLGAAVNDPDDPTLRDICASPVKYTGPYVAICASREEQKTP